LSVASEIHEAVLSHNVIEKVLTKMNPAVDLPTGYTSRLAQTLLNRLTKLQCRALLCFHNMVSCLDIEDFGGPEQLFSIWNSLAQMTFRRTKCQEGNQSSTSSSEHLDFLEASTSALRAILHKLAQNNVNQLQAIGQDELRILWEIHESYSNSAIRINIINVVGIVGQVLSKTALTDSQVLPLLKDIGQFLLDVSTKDTVELIVNAEALDAVFDVFGEDHVDIVCKELNLLERLKQVLASFKNKIHVQKKTLGDHYPTIVMAKDNLMRFIKYKTDKICSANGKH